MPVKTKTESWVQTFREQLKSFMAPKAAWYVQESRGKISGLALCIVPTPDSAKRSGLYPGLQLEKDFD